MTRLAQCPILGAVPTDDLLTTAQAASVLGVHVRTVHRLVRDGRLTAALKLPTPTGAYLFEPDDVAALAAEKAAS